MNRITMRWRVGSLMLIATLGVAMVGVSAGSASTGGKKLIVIDVPPLSNPFFAAEAVNAKKEAVKLGYRTLVLDNNSDPNLQATQIDEAISDHASAIILDNASASASAAAIEKAAKDAGLDVKVGFAPGRMGGDPIRRPRAISASRNRVARRGELT